VQIQRNSASETVVGETVRRERRWTTAGATPARELVPPGSNRGGSGGNKAVGALGVKGAWRLREPAGRNVSER